MWANHQPKEIDSKQTRRKNSKTVSLTQVSLFQMCKKGDFLDVFCLTIKIIICAYFYI